MKIPFEQPHLLDYFHVVRRRKKLFLACFAITVISVILGNQYAQPIYQATAQIVINKESSTSVLTGEDTGFRNRDSESAFLNSHYQIMTSRSVLIKVAKALGLDQATEEKEQIKNKTIFAHFKTYLRFLKPIIKPNAKEEKPEQGPNDKLIPLTDALARMIIINPVPGTRLVDIAVEDTVPRSAMEVANTLAEIYIQHDFESNLNATKKRFALLNEQLLLTKKDISESRESIYAFKEKEKIFSLEGQQMVQSKKIGELNVQYLKTKTDKMAIQAKLTELEKIAKKGDYEQSIPSIAESGLVESLYKDLIQAQIELSQFEEVSKTKHPLLEPPEIAEIEVRIGLIKKELNNELQRVIDNLNVEYAILNNRERTLASSLRRSEAEVLKANKVESQYAPLAQEARTNQEFYDLLLTKLKEADIVGGMRRESIQIVEPALLPKYPIKPRKALNLILGVLVGLMLGVGSAFFLEYLDRTIRTPMEVKQYLELPLLCTVPKVPIKGRSGRHG